MPAIGRNARHPPENIQISPAKPRKWMQHQEASKKRPKAAAKVPATGRNARNPRLRNPKSVPAISPYSPHRHKGFFRSPSHHCHQRFANIK